VIRAEDFSSFNVSGETDLSLNGTDAKGRFELRNFPADLRKVMFEFVTPEGTHHKFTTPEGTRLTSEKLPAINISELRTGTARIILEHGVDLNGRVTGPNGEPVPGAQVTEARMIGNLQVLSRNQTDARGEFRLPNRKPREILLAASSAGYG